MCRNVVKQLSNDPRKTFLLEHMGYVKFFLQKAKKSEIENFLNLIKSGQIEVLNRASVALHDEACAYYYDILTNFRAGADFYKTHINRSLGHLSQTAWKIDSFGHSYTSMKLQKLNGVEYLVLGRASTVEKQIRQIEGNQLFEWQLESKSAQNESKDTQKIRT